MHKRERQCDTHAGSGEKISRLTVSYIQRILRIDMIQGTYKIEVTCQAVRLGTMDKNLIVQSGGFYEAWMVLIIMRDIQAGALPQLSWDSMGRKDRFWVFWESLTLSRN